MSLHYERAQVQKSSTLLSSSYDFPAHPPYAKNMFTSLHASRVYICDGQLHAIDAVKF